MPKINVYLPDDLAEAVKDIDLPVSAICQRALEQAIRRVTAIREVTRGTLVAPAGFGFTNRALGMVESAQAAARSAGLPGMGTEHLLTAVAADEDGLAMRVLNAMEITGQQIRSALTGRDDHAGGGAEAGPESAASAATKAGFGPYAATALELAATESAALGHNYIGSEHLLLGLIGEPDGVAGSVLRSLGAELRVTRRTVTAALAGWAAYREHVTRPAAAGASSQAPASDATLAAQISAAVKTELAPVLSRIEHLENALAE